MSFKGHLTTILAAFEIHHEKSRPVKVGFFVSGTEVQEGCAEATQLARRSLMRADLPVRSRK